MSIISIKKPSPKKEKPYDSLCVLKHSCRYAPNFRGQCFRGKYDNYSQLNMEINMSNHFERPHPIKESTVNAERQRLLDVLETLPAYVVLLTPDYHVSFANRFFRERFGEDRGRRCFEYLFNRIEPCEICETYKVLKTMGPHDWEWSGPDGRTYDIHDIPFFDMDGSPLILEMGIDITERKRAERELRRHKEHLEDLVRERTADLETKNVQLAAEITERMRTEEALRRAKEEWERTFDAVPDLIAILDEKHRVVRANRAMADRLKCTPEECVGVPCHVAVHGTEAPPAFCPHIMTLTDCREHQAEIQEDRLGGHFLVSTTPICDDQGKLIGSVHVARDITERKKAEEALRESEQRVQLKLESILSPEGDIGNLDLSDIIDTPAIQSLIADFYKLAPIPIGILDLEGRVLAGAGWQDICTKFHRVHPETQRYCVESDTQLSKGLLPGEYRLYKCKNNMWDIATPIVVGGRHMGNVFSGQFFFDDEPLDYELFRSQARQHGFDEKEYIAALEAVPRLSRESVDTFIAFYMRFADILSKLSYSNIKLARSLAQQETLMQSLQQSRDDLNFAQSVSHTGSWRLDARQDKLDWSDETHRIFGIPKGTPMTYEAFLSRVHPDDRHYVDEKWAQALAGGPYHIEHRIVVGDGVKWVRERAELEFDNEGSLLGGFGIVQDITERKRAENALRESEARSRLLSWTAGALLATDNPQRMVNELCRQVMNLLDCQTFFNFLVDEQAGKLHLNACGGVPEEEARKIEWLDFGEAVCGCAARDRVRIIAQDIFHTEDPRTDLVRTYGIQAYACHPLIVQGKLIGTLSFGTKTRTCFSEQDVALMKTVTDQVATAMERMRLIEELQKSRDELELRVQERTAELVRRNKELQEFVFVASHDLREPLRKIQAFGDLAILKSSSGLTDAGRDCISRMQGSASRMQTLLKSLLSYSRVTNHTEPFEETDINKSVMTALSNLEVMVGESRAVLEIGQLPTLEADRVQMVQLFQNLISNALKFRHPDKVPRVRIHSKAVENSPGKKNAYKIFVEDNGIGFDEQYLDKIFKPFQRLHGRGEYEGVGIGLAICRKIVDNYGGNLTAKSVPGKGATFTVTLPMKQNKDLMACSTDQRPGGARSKNGDNRPMRNEA